MAEPDTLCALGARGKKDLGGGGVRVFLKEVVLDLPYVIDAEFVAEFDLCERFLVETAFGILAPRLRQLVFVEHAKFHVLASFVRSLLKAGS